MKKENVDSGTAGVYKEGMNASDQAQLAKGIAAGVSLEKISRVLMVTLRVVKSFAKDKKVKALVKANKEKETVAIASGNNDELLTRITELEESNSELFEQKETAEANGAQAVADLEKLQADMAGVKTVTDLNELLETLKGEDK